MSKQTTAEAEAEKLRLGRIAAAQKEAPKPEAAPKPKGKTYVGDVIAHGINHAGLPIETNITLPVPVTEEGVFYAFSKHNADAGREGFSIEVPKKAKEE